MSHAANDKLMDEFWDACVTETQCPYCGNHVQTDPHMGCCGEVHADEVLLSPCGEYVLRQHEYDIVDEAALKSAFAAWRTARVES